MAQMPTSRLIELDSCVHFCKLYTFFSQFVYDEHLIEHMTLELAWKPFSVMLWVIWSVHR